MAAILIPGQAALAAPEGGGGEAQFVVFNGDPVIQDGEPVIFTPPE